METLLEIHTTRLFPCPLCGDALEIRESKKGKPYVVCNACGVQMFVRNDVGIRRLEKLIEDAKSQSIWERLTELRQRYEKRCSHCRKKFWITEENRQTDWFGELEGYSCPECGTLWKPAN